LLVIDIEYGGERSPSVTVRKTTVQHAIAVVMRFL